MSSVAFVPNDNEPLPRPKALPLHLLSGGAEPPNPRLPPQLFWRKGARETLFQCPVSTRALLTEACAKVTQHFGNTALVALEQFVDPDEPTAEPLLYLVIGTDLTARAAREALDRFQDDFWLDNVDRGGDKVHLTLEFV